MSRKTGFIALLVGSEILGIAMGESFFRLAMPSGFSSGSSHIGFLAQGAILGFVLFLWSLLAIFLDGLWKKPGMKTPNPNK